MCIQIHSNDQVLIRLQQLYRDGKRVLECLQRALRVADSCMESATSIELFVEILDRYVYYFDQRNESVSGILPITPFQNHAC